MYAMRVFRDLEQVVIGTRENPRKGRIIIMSTYGYEEGKKQRTLIECGGRDWSQLRRWQRRLQNLSGQCTKFSLHQPVDVPYWCLYVS